MSRRCRQPPLMVTELRGAKLMAAGDFAGAAQEFAAVVGNTGSAGALYAIGDICVMSRALDSADAAYKKGPAAGGGFDRAQNGQKLFAQIRQSALDTTKIAEELPARNSGTAPFRNFARR